MQSIDFSQILWTMAVFVPPLIFAITVHETAHGWVAKQLGDPTADREGRLTLNPIKHVDPIGTLAVPLGLFIVSLGQVTFGWAKPVPVDYSNLRSPRRDMALVAAAGPASNLLMATGWSLMILAQLYLLPVEGTVGEWIFETIHFGIWINVVLALMNAVPIPPLDGSRVLAAILPPRAAAVLDKIEPFGIFIIIGLIGVLWYTGQLGPLIEPPIGAVYGFFQRLPGIF